MIERSECRLFTTLIQFCRVDMDSGYLCSLRKVERLDPWGCSVEAGEVRLLWISQQMTLNTLASVSQNSYKEAWVIQDVIEDRYVP